VSELDAAVDRDRPTCRASVWRQVVAESLCDALDVRAGEKVLDVVAGDGTSSLAAARRGCDVASATAEALPFVDGVFDAVMSSFGVMCAPCCPSTVPDLLRVCRSTGRLGLALWTPDGFMGRLFGVAGICEPPRPSDTLTARRDLEDRLEHWFRASAWDLHTTYRDVVHRHRAAEHWVDALETCDGPVRDVFARLPQETRRRLEHDVLQLIDEFNIATPPAVVVQSQYVEVVVVKK
jgi:SAM-dependent methyltransferase